MKFIIYQAMHTNRMFSFLFYHVINCLGFSLCLNPPEISFIHYKDIIVFMKLGICLPSLLSVTLYFSLLVALVLLSMNNNLLILLCVFFTSVAGYSCTVLPSVLYPQVTSDGRIILLFLGSKHMVEIGTF